MEFSDADHDLFCDFVEAVLVRYHQEQSSLVDARADIMEPIVLLAKGDGNFRKHMDLVLGDWKDGRKTSRKPPSDLNQRAASIVRMATGED